MAEELAIVTDAHVGTRDVGRPILWFTVGGEGWGALQIFDLAAPKAVDIIASVERLENLHGKPCIVDRDVAEGTCRFKRLVKV